MIKRSVTIQGHRTSISLEEEFWVEIKRIACSRDISVNTLVGDIDEARGDQNLSSALRIYILKDLQSKNDCSALNKS